MKSFCCNCNKNKEVIVIANVIDLNGKELQVKVKCKKCNCRHTIIEGLPDEY